MIPVGAVAFERNNRAVSFLVGESCFMVVTVRIAECQRDGIAGWISRANDALPRTVLAADMLPAEMILIRMPVEGQRIIPVAIGNSDLNIHFHRLRRTRN